MYTFYKIALWYCFDYKHLWMVYIVIVDGSIETNIQVLEIPCMLRAHRLMWLGLLSEQLHVD